MSIGRIEGGKGSVVILMTFSCSKSLSLKEGGRICYGSWVDRCIFVFLMKRFNDIRWPFGGICKGSCSADVVVIGNGVVED